MNLPPSFFTKTIKEKEIFFFSAEKDGIEDPHFFICIKKSENEVLLFTCCTSKGDKRENYITRKGYPTSTLVYIKPEKTLPFTKDTFVDCNKCFQYTLSEFRRLCDENKITYKGEISDTYYEQIIIGLLDSPEIDEATKLELPDPNSIGI